MSFTHYDVNGVITFYIHVLIFNIISTIFNLIFKAFYGCIILGQEMRNTAQSPIVVTRLIKLGDINGLQIPPC